MVPVRVHRVEQHPAAAEVVAGLRDGPAADWLAARLRAWTSRPVTLRPSTDRPPALSLIVAGGNAAEVYRRLAASGLFDLSGCDRRF